MVRRPLVGVVRSPVVAAEWARTRSIVACPKLTADLTSEDEPPLPLRIVATVQLR